MIPVLSEIVLVLLLFFLSAKGGAEHFDQFKRTSGVLATG